MASSTNFAIFSMLISLAFLFLSIDPSFANHHHHEKHYSKLKKLCSKTANRHTCIKLMKSDSRTDDADTRGLVEISIDLALSKAKDIHRDLNSLSDRGSDYPTRDRYTSCSKNYNDAIRNLEQSKRLFNDGDYKRIPVQINDTVEEVRDCTDQLEKLASDSLDLKGRNKDFLIVCEFAVKASSKYSRNDDSNDDNNDDN